MKLTAQEIYFMHRLNYRPKRYFPDSHVDIIPPLIIKCTVVDRIFRQIRYRPSDQGSRTHAFIFVLHN